jgi:hypothetical protein
MFILERRELFKVAPDESINRLIGPRFSGRTLNSLFVKLTRDGFERLAFTV